MRVTSVFHALVLGWLLAMSLPEARAQVPVVQHRLTVAAHPSLNITNSYVDATIARMNVVIHSASYAWDLNCSQTFFQRSGDVIESTALLTSGTYDELAANVRAVAPTADLFIVENVICSGAVAAGCSPLHAEPIVAAHYPDWDDLIWLHERGHGVGLPHSAEGPKLDDGYPEEVGKRFMFWMLGRGHVGKNQFECESFNKSQLASVSVLASPQLAATLPASISNPVTDIPAAPAAAAPSPTPVMVASAVAAASSPVPVDIRPNAVVPAGMSKTVYDLISTPWLDGAPVSAIQKLSQQEIESVRQVLHGSPGPLWPQAIGVLGIAGNASDIALIKHALELPLPAVLPGMGASKEITNLRRIKLAAPLSLGILANRTQSESAVSTLKAVSDAKTASNLIGDVDANNLSKMAVRGLSVAVTPNSERFLEAVSAIRQSGPLDKPVGRTEIEASRVAPLTDKEVAHFKATSEAVKASDVFSVLKPTR